MIPNAVCALGESVRQSGNTVFLEGVFTIESVSNLVKQTKRLSDEVTALDLKGVTQLDSSLLALLVEYKKAKPDLKIVNLPTSLVQLMAVYQLNDFL